jgi:hypothetical protein
MAADDDGHWHIDKKVPLALLWGILGQTVVVIIAGTVIYTNVETQGRDLTRLDAQVGREVARLDSQFGQLAGVVNQQAVQFGRIEENMSALRGSVADMRSDLRRMVEIWEGFKP